MQRALTFTLLMIPCVVACGGSQAAKPANKPASSPFAESAVEAKSVSPNLAVSGDIDKECSLHFNNSVESPKFDYDRFQLDEADREVLDQVATCLTAGPLKGRKVQLVGRADPRGTDEYNLALGDSRARTVVTYLTDVGVDADQLAVLTRGELDATGDDEDSWKLDRRVDLRLVKLN